MGVLINGVWTDGELPQETGEGGRFKRAESRFRDRITADGSSGFKAEPGRYHLYAAHGCPWAHRALIYRALKRLDGLISVAYAVPGVKKTGWTFEDDPRFPDCAPDAANGFHYLYEAYVATDKNYTGKVTVPTLWDKKTKRIVNNELSEIIRMLNTEFDAITGNKTDYYPAALRAKIDAINERIYSDVNNGVYRCGFAKSQTAYEEAYDSLFNTLDYLEQQLSRQRYLAGSQITEADRPELQRLLKALEPGAVVVVTRLDRLARSTIDLLTTIKQIADKGCLFNSLADPWADTTTPGGRLMLTVLGGLAEFERELIKARTSEGRERAKRAGVQNGAQAET